MRPIAFEVRGKGLPHSGIEILNIPSSNLTPPYSHSDIKYILSCLVPERKIYAALHPIG